ncbi:NADH-quinone oxidoreductase subunit NuoK [Buchnera aphidicola (Kurisakia onigurumii)]|uniref:NADH-quinone oxidoreductase subunit NuoK n=1 Tax=Buchnera aphidicola TaxID=9 RepID=UPI0031B67C42
MISFFCSLILSIILFILGLFSLIIRKNFLFMLISLEIMINSIVLALIIVSSYYESVEGQIMYILSITVAAAEVSVGLAILMRIYRTYQTLNIDLLSEKNK